MAKSDAKMKKKTRVPFSGGVAICQKRRDGKQFKVWVEKAPELTAQAGSLKAAEEALVNLLWERFDLDEPIAFQYRDEPDEADAIVVLGVNETTDCGDPGRYFEEGFCLICQSGRGRRSQERLEVEWLPAKTMSGLMVRPQPSHKLGRATGMLLLHASLSRELTTAAKADCEFRSVTVRRKSNDNYLEVIPRGAFHRVLPKSQKGYAGWKCHVCGNMRLSLKGGKAAIARRDADVIRKSGLGALDSPSWPNILVTTALFRRLQKTTAGKGLLASPVTVLPDDQIAINPRLMKLV